MPISILRGLCLAAAVASTALPAVAQSPTQAEMKATLHVYLDGLNQGDLAKLKTVLADNAMVEDPLGTPLKKALPFYSGLIGAKVKFHPISMTASGVNKAAMAATAGPGDSLTNVIEIFTFSPDGKITSMKSYWGSEDGPK